MPIISTGLIGVKRPSIIDEKELLLCIGDSTSAGSNGATGAAPTPPTGKSFWYRRSDTSIQTLSPDVVSAPSGTQYPEAVIRYTNIVNKKITVIPSGLGGSYVSNTGTNWSTSGTLYALMQTDVTNALAATGKKLKGIYISVSVNDVVNGVSSATIQTAYDSLLSRLQSDYPNVPICIDKIGTQAGTADAARATMQAYQAGKASSLITVIDGMSAMDGLGYMADALHPTQTGNNYRGDLIGDWLLNLRY